MEEGRSQKDRVHETLHSLIQLFESGQAPLALAYTALPRPDIPASQWSLCNNLILWINGTGDARGFRQWQQVNRYVRKGAHALYILAPSLKTRRSNREDGLKGCSVEATPCDNTNPQRSASAAPPDEKPKQVLIGFRAVPVFRFEDTDGEPLQYDLHPIEPPPLAEVAAKWGLAVRYVGCSGPYLGYYRQNKDRPCEITLATHEEQVFFHELAHAAQHRVWPDLKPHQKLRMEVSAELASCVLARLYGRSSPNEGNSYEYIKAYCEQEGKSLGRTLWGMVSDTEKILRAIVEANTPTPTA